MRSGPVAAGHEVVGRREALVAPESATSAVAAVAAVATVATVASTVVRVRAVAGTRPPWRGGPGSDHSGWPCRRLQRRPPWC